MTAPDPPFGELSESEHKLLEAATSGAWADVQADADRHVRAGLLAELLTGGRARPRAAKLAARTSSARANRRTGDI